MMRRGGVLAMDDLNDRAPTMTMVRAQKAHRVGGRTQKHNTTLPLSCAKQRLAILHYLVAGNRLTTLHARDELCIMHPAARILELRNDGYNIVTHKRTDQDASGTKHSVAEYVLMNG